MNVGIAAGDDDVHGDPPGAFGMNMHCKHNLLASGKNPP